ncbi:MAG: hypothetical protein ACD_79C00235G0005 [uncultured bacterium]|nr:MAG: hypothetical protein ACD_79C00235G0005 [uncultured bacterium]
MRLYKSNFANILIIILLIQYKSFALSPIHFSEKIYKPLKKSAQFFVIEIEGYIYKFEKTKEETNKVGNSWNKLGMSDLEYENWLNIIENGKKQILLLVKYFSNKSEALLHMKKVTCPNVFIKDFDGEIIEMKNRITYKQEKVETLGIALKRLYEEGDENTITSILRQIIEKNQNGLWKFGFYDAGSAFQYNWGVKFKNNSPDVRLLDYGELIEISDYAFAHIKERDFEKRWEIIKSSHRSSIITLTNENIAYTFLNNIKNEFTVEKLRYYYQQYIHNYTNRAS